MVSLAFTGLGVGVGTASVPANTYNGWFFGGGLEASLAGLLPGLPAGFFWRTEYRYADYQSADLGFALPGVPAPAPLITEHVHPRTQTVTTSLVWRFNWMGGPVTARY